MELHDQIWPGFSMEWLAWEFLDNPYLPEAPIVVAETDGEIVGARPNLAFQMRAGDTYHTALQYRTRQRTLVSTADSSKRPARGPPARISPLASAESTCLPK